jgi:hypothetical protein
VAAGYAGQDIIVVPDLEQVVVTTADAGVPYASVMPQANQIEAFVESAVIPSITEVRGNGSTDT